MIGSKYLVNIQLGFSAGYDGGGLCWVAELRVTSVFFAGVK